MASFFTNLLAEIKHRGAFEQAYLGFCNLCNFLWRRKTGEICQPPDMLKETMAALTGTGVNFIINILHTNFSYERCFGSFFYIHVTRGKLPKQCLYEKCARKTLMKLTGTGKNKFCSTRRSAGVPFLIQVRNCDITDLCYFMLQLKRSRLKGSVEYE